MNDELQLNNQKSGDIFQQIFAKNWDEIFIFDSIKGINFTYQEFFDLVLKIKTGLEKKGVRSNDHICSILNNSIELIALFFATILLQITLVCIDPLRGSDEIKEMISMKKTQLCLIDDKFENISLNKVEKISDLIKNIEINKSAISELEIFQGLDYDKVFTITFTSGSTGKPKGVMHSVNNYLKSSILFNRRFDFEKNDIFYHNLSLSYIGGILNLLFLPFFAESKIVLSEQFNISKIPDFWSIPDLYSVNTFWFTPTELSLLLKLDRGDNGIRYCKKHKIIGLVGTASLNQDIKIDFEKKYSLKLFESYCLSETFFVTTNYENNDKINHTGPLLDDVNVSFTEENEILLYTPSMFLGYVGLSNDEFFNKDGLYLSGDLGTIDNNSLKILGRKKDLIIKGGMNISPKRIEDMIISLRVFDEISIVGVNDYYMGERIVCFYVSEKSEMSDELKFVNNKIIEKLGMHSKVDEFTRLKTLPKTPSGKINKPLMKKKYEESKNS